jgi:tetratricopeptide (TPR) repeat protein
VARADRRRSERAKPAAAAGRYESAYVGTEGLFFQRLRRQAKWVFVLLAVVFAGSFVVFGVGSEVPGGIADILQGGGNSGAPSVSDARERTEENPRDAQAWRDLSTALQTDGRPEEALAPLERYLALRPRDEAALREIAAIHLTEASELRDRLQVAQYRAAFQNPGQAFMPPPTTPLGQALSEAPISRALSEGSNEQVSGLYTQMQAEYQRAKLRYAELAKLAPEDANLQLQIADAALNSNDTASALAAYKEFLKLAPDDPNAEIVRQEVKRLEEASAAGSATAGTADG